MEVTVVHDTHGRIISISIPGDIGGRVSGIAKGGALLGHGQQVHTLQVPTEFEKRPLFDFHQLLRVEQTNKGIRLVKASEFKEPFLHEP